jgi:hypothetical protein
MLKKLYPVFKPAPIPTFNRPFPVETDPPAPNPYILIKISKSINKKVKILQLSIHLY